MQRAQPRQPCQMWSDRFAVGRSRATHRGRKLRELGRARPPKLGRNEPESGRLEPSEAPHRPKFAKTSPTSADPSKLLGGQAESGRCMQKASGYDRASGCLSTEFIAGAGSPELAGPPELTVGVDHLSAPPPAPAESARDGRSASRRAPGHRPTPFGRRRDHLRRLGRILLTGACADHGTPASRPNCW